MLGQPVYFLTPDVVGVHLTGRLAEGVTATDLVLAVTEMLRKAKVVGKFVEFFGEGAASLAVTDRATVANMAPEYGATMGFFPVDEESCRYLLATGRTDEQVDAFRAYYQAQGLFGMPPAGRLRLHRGSRARPLAASAPSVAGPEAPAGPDRAAGPEVARSASSSRSRSPRTATARPAASLSRAVRRDARTAGEARAAAARIPPSVSGALRAATPTSGPRSRWPTTARRPTARRRPPDASGPASRSATATCSSRRSPPAPTPRTRASCSPPASSPKKAVERGLTVSPRVKASLAPGSRVVTDYLARRRGSSRTSTSSASTSSGTAARPASATRGRSTPGSRRSSTKNDLVTASVLSGNRNFEARVHQ